MRYITIILALLLFTSCRTRYKTIETHSTDTIYKKEIIKIDKPQLNSIVIDNICDSLTGLKLINYTSITDKVTTTLKSVNNSLILEVNVDSIVNSRIENYKSSLKTEIVKEKIEVRYIPKFFWYSLIINILSIGWIFRKPIIKFIKPI